MTDADALHIVCQHLRQALGEVPVKRRFTPEAVVQYAELVVTTMDNMRDEYLKCAMQTRQPVAK